MNTEGYEALIFNLAEQLERLQQRVHMLEGLLALQNELSELPVVTHDGMELEN